MFIQYTPTRIITGSGGKLECDVQQYSVTDSPEGKEHTALSGRTEHTVYRIDRLHKLKTVPLMLSDSELAVWREFGASCAFGEFFTLDPLGTEAAPDSPVTVRMKMKTFKENRMAGRFFTFSFTAVEVIY